MKRRGWVAESNYHETLFFSSQRLFQYLCSYKNYYEITISLCENFAFYFYFHIYLVFIYILYKVKIKWRRKFYIENDWVRTQRITNHCDNQFVIWCPTALLYFRSFLFYFFCQPTCFFACDPFSFTQLFSRVNFYWRRDEWNTLCTRGKEKFLIPALVPLITSHSPKPCTIRFLTLANFKNNSWTSNNQVRLMVINQQ